MRGNIIIIGDSWGAGEWDCNNNVIHNGLAEYIKNDGYNVYNLSLPGSGNSAISYYLESFIKCNQMIKIDKIFVIQSEYSRDWDIAEQRSKVDSIKELEIYSLMRFYRKLSEIISTYNASAVYVIGGVADSLPEMYFKQIENIFLICQSWTNLIINGDNNIKTPVYSWYNQYSEDIINMFKDSSQSKKDIVNLLENAEQRYKLLSLSRKYFWPDGTHPNRIGHQILFDYLKKNETI